MLTSKKTVVVTGLLACAGAVWAPRLMRRDGPDPGLVQEEVPAILDEVSVSFEADAGSPGPAESAPASPASADTPPAEASAADEDRPLPAPTDEAAGLDSGASGGGLQSEAGNLLASIARSLEAVESRRRGTAVLFSGGDPWESPQSNEVVVESEEDERDEGLEDWQAVRNFLADNPVGGVLISEEDSLALVGSRVVRPGDRIAGGLLVVSEIARDGVRYRFGETAVVHPLPPFRASGAVTSEMVEENEGESEPGSGGDGPAGEGDSGNGSGSAESTEGDA